MAIAVSIEPAPGISLKRRASAAQTAETADENEASS